MTEIIANITISHELNLKGPVQQYNRERYYPLHIKLTGREEEISVTSKISGYFNAYSCEIERYTENNPLIKKFFFSNYFRESDIIRFTEEKVYPFYHLLKDEEEIIGKILEIRKLSPIKQEVSQKNFSVLFDKYTTGITEIFDSRIKENYLAEVKKIFLKTIDSETDKMNFNISNFLLYYINWENLFYNFYETALELMHAPIKNLENQFETTFRTQLKAFLAYHSKEMLLQRFLEKRETGKITSISYLDWITDIKEFLIIEFEKIFGEKKAIQYILSLDMLLKSELEDEQQLSAELNN